MKYRYFQALISHELTEMAKKLPPPEQKRGRKPKNNMKKLAEELDVPVSTLTNWNNGDSLPRDEQIRKLVRKLRPTNARRMEELRKAINQARDADRQPGEGK